jgi:hypothetical protein
MTIWQARKLLSEIKLGMILANQEGDEWRKDYLRYVRREIKKKIARFYEESSLHLQ